MRKLRAVPTHNTSKKISTRAIGEYGLAWSSACPPILSHVDHAPCTLQLLKATETRVDKQNQQNKRTPNFSLPPFENTGEWGERGRRRITICHHEFPECY